MTTPRMQFFDFGNSETFHYFRWLTHPGNADLPALVQKAIVDAEDSADSVSCQTRERLADALGELLNEHLYQNLGILPEGHALGDVWHNVESLWEPLLAAA